MNQFQKFWAGLVVVFGLSASAFAGQLNLGVQYDGWNSNYLQPFNGWEVLAPFSLAFDLDKGIGIYAQTEFASGHYTDSLGAATETLNLNSLSDSVIGTEISFKSFSLPSILNIGVNIPTGDSTWEGKQLASNIPTEFVDSRYRGRGFGVSGFYGLSLPAGTGEFGVATGYLYSGAFIPALGLGPASQNLKMGDSIFLALNHVQPFSSDQNETIRLSAFYFLTTQQGGQNSIQMGPNINASYSWSNPSALSFEVGAQAYLPGQRVDNNGNFGPEPHYSYGPRFYVSPSYAFGDFTLGGMVKYVMPNGYAVTDAFYAACYPGFLFGLDPSYRLKLDSDSALKFTASYDYIIAQNAGVDNTGALTNVIYGYWTFGTSYEIKL
ncbi:MAG TPA: hypothetical protein VIJ93_00065 [bacterium]